MEKIPNMTIEKKTYYLGFVTAYVKVEGEDLPYVVSLPEEATDEEIFEVVVKYWKIKQMYPFLD